MGQNEEMRNNNVEDAVQSGNIKKEQSAEQFDLKTIIIAIVMLLLIVWGAVCVFLVPSLYYEIGTLKTERSNNKKIEAIGSTLEGIQDFSNYIESIDTSRGFTAEEFLKFEEKYFNFFMLEMINENEVSVYIEEKVVETLEEALKNTTDSKTIYAISALLETHKEILEGKMDELREIEDMYYGAQNTEKSFD